MAPQKIAGRYEVQRCIGRGGMGMVWLCRDPRLGRDVAIKQIGTLPGETVPDLARAMREARTSAALNHTNIVSIYDVVEERDHIWLVMEYVASRTLGEILAEDGPLPPERAVWIGAQIAEGLAAAHAAGTIHRDVKPGNILVTREQVAKLSDFGIARAHDQGQLTRSGLITGTPAYFSPELARGEDPTPAADVWALGATLYAAVEGHPPYRDQPNALALLATIASSWPPLPHHAGFITGPISRMLDPDPRSRWSMTDAAHVLRRLAERHATDLTRVSTAGAPTWDGGYDVDAAGAAVVADGAAEAHRADRADRADGDDRADRADRSASRPTDNRRGTVERLVVAALLGLLTVAAVAGFLLFHNGASDRRSALTQDNPPGHHHTRKAEDTGSGTTGTTGQTPPSTPTPTPTPTSTPTSAPTLPVGHSGSGPHAQRFVRRYYALLPSDTRIAWSALSPGFQNRIGGYDHYRGFWSTISSVSVNHTTRVGHGAVDVSLTYTTVDGRVDSEVRRLFLARGHPGYLIDHDAVVG
jgi:eukaryotic-like serine/threonine-protein kinase